MYSSVLYFWSNPKYSGVTDYLNIYSFQFKMTITIGPLEFAFTIFGDIEIRNAPKIMPQYTSWTFSI